MPRTARACVADLCYHVLSRGNRRSTVFFNGDDYRDFLSLMSRARERVPMRIVSYCLMPNHFHLVLWPRGDRDMSRWMHWLLTMHAQRHHRRHATTGRIWENRFKAFPIQADHHLVAVMRYVERNPLRAGLVPRAQAWPWSSLPERLRRTSRSILHSPPVDLPAGWSNWVEAAQTGAELRALRRSVGRGRPFGDPTWSQATAARLGLESTLRPRGRPRTRMRSLASEGARRL